MSKKSEQNVADYIVPLEMNGLQGRMLRMPPPKNKSREILFVYGHHSSLERWWGVVQDLNQYGGVTMPDLPGFGGMQSLYRIGEKPDIDTLADYLAAFMKLRYKRRRVTIAGLSFGFVVVTRMLQRYPDLAKRVDLLISVAGFAHHEDFAFTATRMNCYRTASRFMSWRLPALFFRNVLLHPAVLRLVYARTRNAKEKFDTTDKTEFDRRMNFEIYLWHANDVRTHMATTAEFLRLDNCQRHINLPVHHVSVKADRYFDNHIVEQHFRVIFSDFTAYKSRMGSHAPSVIASKREAAPLLPRSLRTLLNS